MKLFIIFGMALLVAATAHGREVRDQSGRLVILPECIERVVSLAPGITEIIYSLGEERKLVGVTEYCNYPAPAAGLPKIGSFVRPDIERIVSLRPDICFAVKGRNSTAIAEILEALGIPVYTVDPQDIEQIMQTIRGIGDILGATAAARRITDDMDRRIRRLKKLTETISTRPRVFFQLDPTSLITAGTPTFIHELITLAGGINLGAGPVPYPRFSVEQILSLDPDVVVMTSMSRKDAPEAMTRQWRQWSQLKAVRQNRIHVVEPDLFNRPTPRLVDGLEVLAKVLHPELNQVDDDR